MTFIVTDNCVDCKYTDCVLVCPVGAIYAEDELPEESFSALQYNADEAKRLIDAGVEPITEQKKPLPTAENKRSQLGF